MGDGHQSGRNAAARRRMRKALAKLDLFVVSDNVLSNDTINAGAHVLLPAAAWGEKDGTVTNSERRISRQRAFLPLPGEARPDWWIVTQVAQRLGFGDAFNYASAGRHLSRARGVVGFRERRHPRFRCRRARGAERRRIQCARSGAMAGAAGSPRAETRFFAHGGFFTANRKARLIAPERPAPRASISTAFRCASIPGAYAINGTP